MKIFGFEIKRNKGRAYSGLSFGSLKTPELNMETYYKLYRQNSDLRRCVEEKQETSGKGGFEIVEGYGEKMRVIENNSQILEFLNNQRNFEELKNIIIRDIEISGNAYLEIVKNGNGQVVGFDVLDPRTISIIADKYGNIGKYIQKVNGDMVEFEPEDIYHIKDKVDMDNEVFGISKVETLVYDLLGDKEASLSNYAFFKNNALPASLVILDSLSEEEMELALKQLRQQFSGGARRHSISVGSGIKEVKQIGTSQRDMEFFEYRKFNTERVCAVMGVPKVILNYTDGVNYTNAEVQYRKFIENSIRPLERKLEQVFTDLIQLVAPNYRFRFIDNHINDLADRIKTYETMLRNGFMTINEVRQEIGLNRYEEEIADKPIIGSNFTLLEDIDLQIEPPKDEDTNK